jgi:hypothetical protein
LSQQIFRMRMSIPVKPGPLTLLYPQWLPANHGPNGPITQLAGLKFTANGKPVEWTRDPVQVFAFHVTCRKAPPCSKPSTSTCRRSTRRRAASR